MSNDITVDAANGTIYFPRLSDEFGIVNLATYDNAIWGNQSPQFERTKEGIARVAACDDKISDLLGVSEMGIVKCPVENSLLDIRAESLAVLRNGGYDSSNHNYYPLAVNSVITPLTNLGLIIAPADCAVAVVVHPDTEYYAFIHLGSKEIFTAIYESTLDLMLARTGLKNLAKAEIYLYPYICPQHYEYGTDFVQKMSESVKWMEQYTVDLDDPTKADKVGFDFIGRLKDHVAEKYGLTKVYESGICNFESAQEGKLYSSRLTRSDKRNYPRSSFSVAVARA